MKRSTVVFVVFASLSVLVVLYNIYRAGRKRELAPTHGPRPVTVSRVETRSLEVELDEVGDIRGIEEVDVTPKVGGEIIKSILVDRGSRVRKGELLALLDTSTVERRVAELRSRLRAQREVELERRIAFLLAKKDFERYRNLYKHGAVSRQAFEHMEAKYKRAMDSYRAATYQRKATEAALERLMVLYSEYKVVSPTDGYVVDRFFDPGERSEVGRPILRISRDDTVKVVVHVPERYLGEVHPGLPVEVRVDAYPGRVFPGRVAVVSPGVDPATRTFRVEAHIPNREHLLHTGMFARVRLVLGRRRATVVPVEALMRLPGSGSYYVFVVKGGRAYMRNVKVGVFREDIAEVVHGLREGEYVVVRGGTRLRDGQPVVVSSEYRF